jgi:hypothetical protein
MHERIGGYWHVFPTSEQGRKAIWEGFTRDGHRIMEQIFPVEIRKSPREFLPKAEMVVELKCGSIWRLLGADQMEVVGAGPMGVVFSEYSIARPSAWNLIRPMLAENDGWAAFAYTPRGNNHGKALYDMARRDPTWHCELRTLEDTRAYDPERTLSEARASGMPEALIRQEFLCDWTAALVGSVWGDLLEQVEKSGGISDFKHETDAVFTSWDLGISDSTAIWFWRITEGGIDIIDCYENHGKPISHFCDEVDRRGYRYLKHWLPHDARSRTLVTGSSVLEQMRAHWGGNLIEITPSLSLMDGIQATRWLLQQRVRFHSRCADGVNALKSYHYAYDETRKTYSSTPEHDFSSHYADAARYMAVAYKLGKLVLPKPTPAPKPAARSMGSFSLDELFENHCDRGYNPTGRI